MEENINKYKNGLIPGILMHISLGIIYIWTMFSSRLEIELNYNFEYIYLIYMLTLGLSSVIFGYLIDKCIKCSSKLCLLTFIIGAITLSSSIYFKIPILVFISTIFLAISSSLMYLIPLKNLFQWFRDLNKGLVIGTVLTFFGIFRGLSAYVFSILLKDLDTFTLINSLLLTILVFLFIASIFTKFPKNLSTCEISKNNWFKSIINTFKVRRLYIYWIILFLGVTAGYSLLSYKGIFIETLGIEYLSGLLLISGAFLNALGRLGSAAWSDRVKNKEKILSFSLYSSALICIIGFLWIKFIPLTIALCCLFYGILITIVPISLENKYGTNNLGKNLGFLFSAITSGGVVGSIIFGILSGFPESIFRTVLLMLGILFLLGLQFSSDLWEDKKN